MRYSRLPVLVAGAVLMAGATSQTVAPDTPLITNGPIVVDAADFEGNLLRIPEDKRRQVRTSHETVATIIDGIYVTRVFAAMAREAGIDKDVAVQRRLRQVQEGVLADAYLRKLEKEAVPANLEQRARELYQSEPAKYMTPEQVYVQHVLVGLNGRTRETARALAARVASEARGGEDFLLLASRHSDDGRRGKGGDLGYVSPSAFMEPVRNAIAGMKTKGEISDPIESEAGFHVVKFIDRKAPQQLGFEAVKERIMAAERERLQKEKLERLIQEVRSSSTVVVHRDNVEKLVIPVDPELLKKIPGQAAAAAK